MASVINKRQQARNERILQDLLRSVPGNDVCADCQARNPGWASYSLGIFLCVRCAAFHRALGTHISKVKSISMDLWNNEHVENMKRIGNTTSNRLYNPRNVRPVVPFDPDMVDSAMERYIRQKYQHRTLSTVQSATRHNTGSTTSTDDFPPPPPPKPTARFAPNLRSASATFPLTQRDQREKELPSPFPASWSRRTVMHSPISSGKVSIDGDESFGSKLSTLKDLGYGDDKKNAAILKGHDGNLGKAIESLNRLGEGTPRFNSSQPASRLQSGPRTVTDYEPASQALSMPSATAAHSIAGNSAQGEALQNSNPYNPFFAQNTVSSEEQTPLTLDLQAMHISPPTFNPQTSDPWYQPPHTNPFMKPFTPPISPAPYQYSPDPGQGVYSIQHEQQVSQASFDPATRNNPFHRMTQQQNSTSQSVFDQPHYSQGPPSSSVHDIHWQMSQGYAFGPSEQNLQFSQVHHQPTQTHASDSYPLPQSPPSFQNMNPQPQQQPDLYGSNADMWQSSAPFASESYHSYQQPAQNNHRMDKGSILALYNLPQTTSSSIPATDSDIPSFHNPSHVDTTVYQPRRSVTMPASSSKIAQNNNPFTSLMTPANATNVAGGTRKTGHVRQESKEFSSSSMSNGRHSPDAFADLSARFV